MSVDERDEPFSTLPDLGEFHVRGRVTHDAATLRTIAAIAGVRRDLCEAFHAGQDEARGRDRLVSYAAAFLALATLLTALLGGPDECVGALAVFGVAAIVASAWRSGTAVNADRDHEPHCMRGRS